ncbi:DUF4837 family protein [Rasiella rasia]|uniref:DUF4837 family protein n=1 Tax=Rasiella rasia TaxID=2744027 RepID=A0A6G6GMU4_9FLAO|nr:DUF4837 family protein [Rasiella rasia]QIE59905.1 DUF4837 family protein [Rasiella rasia]
MKPIFAALLGLFFIATSCGDGASTISTYRPDSVGNINSLQIVAPEALWNGDVGEVIRQHFAAPADGLPQDEPIYSMVQMKPASFTDFAQRYRLFLHVTLSDSSNVSIKSNSFAKPQVGAFITAPTEAELVELINENKERIKAVFYESEIKEKQKRIKLSLKKLDTLQQDFGVSLKVPTAYRKAHGSKDYYWLRKALEAGTTNIFIYEVPLATIGKDSTIADIITMRNTIGADLLPVEDDSRFITEAAYSPFLFSSELDGKPTYITKGTWEITDAYMAGPFVNYAVRDEANERWLIIEGFTYAPSDKKRDLQFELEAIIKSAKIN